MATRDDWSPSLIEALNSNRAKRGAVSSVVELPDPSFSPAPHRGTTIARDERTVPSPSAGPAIQQSGRPQAGIGAGPAPWPRPRATRSLRLPVFPPRRTTIEVLPDEPRRRRHPLLTLGNRRAVSSGLPVIRRGGRPNEATPRLPSPSPLLLTDGVEDGAAERSTVGRSPSTTRPSPHVLGVTDGAGASAVDLAGLSPPSSPESTNPVIRYVDAGMREIAARRRQREVAARALTTARRAAEEDGAPGVIDLADSPPGRGGVGQVLQGRSMSPVVQDLTKTLSVHEIECCTETVAGGSNAADVASHARYVQQLKEEEEERKLAKEEEEEVEREESMEVVWEGQEEEEEEVEREEDEEGEREGEEEEEGGEEEPRVTAKKKGKGKNEQQ
ncbi:unnamed protein product, partial [Ectocarpus fasciculatus]